MKLWSSLVVLCLLLLYKMGLAQETNCNRTPVYFEGNFTLSCTEMGLSDSLCGSAWTYFMSAFADINPENVQGSNYQPYIDMFPIASMADQTLFWSGTRMLVNIISMMGRMGASVVSSANLPASTIIINTGSKVGCDDLHWCGVEEGGIDTMNDCSDAVSRAFWAQFSATLAMSAHGTVFFLGNGSRNRTYSSGSFFGQFELPNLQSNVSQVVVIVIHPEGEGESCDDPRSESLVALRVQVERNFSYSCYDIFASNSDDEENQNAIARRATDIITAVQRGGSSSMTTMPSTTSAATGVNVSQSFMVIIFYAVVAQKMINIF